MDRPGRDYFGAYRKCLPECDVLLRFRLARLIRDAKFLPTLPGREVGACGQRLRDAVRDHPADGTQPPPAAYLDARCRLRRAGSRGL